MLSNLITFSGNNRDICLIALESTHGDPNRASELLET